MNTKALHFLTLAMACSVSTAALADDYTIEGTHVPDGAVAGRLSVESAAARRDVILSLRLPGRPAATMLRGSGELQGNVVAVELVEAVGAAGRVSGVEGEVLTGTITFLADGDVVIEGTVASGRLSAVGTPADAPVAEEEEDDSLRAKAGHLLGVAKRELKEIINDQAKIKKTFKPHEYLHVGVRTQVRAIEQGDWTPLQRLGAEGKERPVWLVDEVEGGVRIPLNTTIELGEVGLHLGFQPGARVIYQVTDLYEKPRSVTDPALVETMKSMVTRTFQLPLSAGDAQELTVGSRRILDGEATVVVRGDLRYGYEISDIGDVARIGASARVGGLYRIRGRLRFQVDRLGAQRVRLRVTRGTERAREASAEVLVGVAIDDDEFGEEIGSSVDFFHEALADEVEDVLRISLKAKRSRTFEDELDISYMFDLSEAEARAAFDRAVRGDLSAAGDGAVGVSEEFRVFEAEERTYMGADIRLTALLKAGVSRRVSLSALDVEDASGANTHYDVFRFDRERGLSWLRGLSKRHRSVRVELVSETPAGGETRRTLRYAIRIRDPRTTLTDGRRFSRALTGLGLSADSAIPTPDRRFLRSRYGKTRSSLAVEIDEAGLQSILASSEADALAAYAKAQEIVDGEAPEWATEAGRARLRHSSDNEDNRAKAQLRKARGFTKDLMALASGETDADERAERLESLAKRAGYGLVTVTALLQLAPQDSVHIRANMAGERIDIDSGSRGTTFTPVRVDDPRQ